MKKGKIKNGFKKALKLTPPVFALTGILGGFACLGPAIKLNHDFLEFSSSQAVEEYKSKQIKNVSELFNNGEISEKEFFDQTKYWSSSESNNEVFNIVFKDNEEYQSILKMYDNVYNICLPTFLGVAMGGVILMFIKFACLDKRKYSYIAKLNEDENGVEIKVEEDINKNIDTENNNEDLNNENGAY